MKRSLYQLELSEGQQRVENVESLEIVFYGIKGLQAFCCSRHKKPLIHSLNELTDLKTAIERCRSFGYSVDISIYLSNVTLNEFEKENLKLCLIDIDDRSSKADRLVKDLKKCYKERTKKGIHCFCYTDTDFYARFSCVELFTKKFARVTADMYEENSIPFFIEKEQLLKIVKSVYGEEAKKKMMPLKESLGYSFSAVKELPAFKASWIFIREDVAREYYRRSGAKTKNHDACYNKTSNRFEVYTTSSALATRSYSVGEMAFLYKEVCLI